MSSSECPKCGAGERGIYVHRDTLEVYEENDDQRLFAGVECTRCDHVRYFDSYKELGGVERPNTSMKLVTKPTPAGVSTTGDTFKRMPRPRLSTKSQRSYDFKANKRRRKMARKSRKRA